MEHAFEEDFRKDPPVSLSLFQAFMLWLGLTHYTVPSMTYCIPPSEKPVPHPRFPQASLSSLNILNLLHEALPNVGES